MTGDQLSEVEDFLESIPIELARDILLLFYKDIKMLTSDTILSMCEDEINEDELKEFYSYVYQQYLHDD